MTLYKTYKKTQNTTSNRLDRIQQTPELFQIQSLPQITLMNGSWIRLVCVKPLSAALQKTFSFKTEGEKKPC